jgi:hypothetical protein
MLHWAWSIAVKAGKLVGIHLRPHDLRRHAATCASRAGIPIEITSKVVLRHFNLSATQRYLEKSAAPKPVFTFDVFDFGTRLYIAEGSSQGRVVLDIIRFLMELH